jgi:signal transduction histidine kinase
MPHGIKILLVEDNANDAELLVNQLNRHGLDFEYEVVDKEELFVSKLNSKIDIVLSDYALPQFDGFRALELLKQRSDLDIPFIIVSGTIGEDMAVKAMRCGAADYLLKDRIGRLGPAVEAALQQVKERRERKRLEAQFIEAQKMEVVGQLAGGVAHDFNNALAVIMGYGDLIAQDLPPNHELLKYVEEINHAARRAAGLTQQLLIFSRKQTVQASPLNLNEVVESTEKMLRRLIDENIELTISCGENMGQIKADSGYVWQVLMNLVANARDAMPGGGRIEIETSVVTLEEHYVRKHFGTKAGNYVVLRVTDTGAGMTDEVKKHLFEAFYTTKPPGKGTGLGLVTCQKIMRESGGHIDVSSELGKGTTFRIYFPQIEESIPTSVIPVSQTGPMRRGTETLLVVEDEPAVRHLAFGVLRNQGYEVLSAPNGQDALRVASEHRGPPISLVITDVVMPRMGGHAMAEWLKTSYPELKVLFTSGYNEEAIQKHGGMGNVEVNFLPKPYTPRTLTLKVREILDAA